MEAAAFHRLALAATSRFNVVLASSISIVDTATASGAERYQLRANGLGLPAEGVSVKGASHTAAVTALTSELKRLKAEREQSQTEQALRRRAA